MLEVHNTVFVCIDIQGNLAQAMHAKEKLFEAVKKLIAGVVVLDIPLILTEQNPARLGPTLSEIQTLMPSATRPVSKMSFSCCGSEEFVQAIGASKRTDVLLCGIEAHICVYQTACDLLARGYRVHCVADSVSSRTQDNKAIGLEKIKNAGGVITSTETALFELLKTAEAPAFKAIAKIIR
ncbi:MAG: hydrolase [Pseudomonadota bacterium]